MKILMRHLALTSTVLAMGASPAFAGKTEVFTGEATSGGKVVYTERHVVSLDDQGQAQEAETTYTDTKGKVISVLKSDFRTSLTAPDHTLHNMLTGEVEGVRSSGDKIVLFDQENGKKEQTKALDKNFSGDRIAFGCQGLNYYLSKNLDTFEQKKSLPVKFLFPGKLDSYDFRVKFIKERPDGMVEVEIEIESWILRLFAPKLHVIYDKKTQHIVRYEGISNIKDEKGKNQNVVITYKYETPSS